MGGAVGGLSFGNFVFAPWGLTRHAHHGRGGRPIVKSLSGRFPNAQSEVVISDVMPRVLSEVLQLVPEKL